VLASVAESKALEPARKELVKEVDHKWELVGRQAGGHNSGKRREEAAAVERAVWAEGHCKQGMTGDHVEQLEKQELYEGVQLGEPHRYEEVVHCRKAQGQPVGGLGMVRALEGCKKMEGHGHLYRAHEQGEEHHSYHEEGGHHSLGEKDPVLEKGAHNDLVHEEESGSHG